MVEKCFLWTYTEKVSAYVHKLLGIWQAECDCGHIEKNWRDMSILMSVAAKWYKQSSEKANKVIDETTKKGEAAGSKVGSAFGNIEKTVVAT